jgi:hypothetical protein
MRTATLAIGNSHEILFDALPLARTLRMTSVRAGVVNLKMHDGSSWPEAAV